MDIEPFAWALIGALTGGSGTVIAYMAGRHGK